MYFVITYRNSNGAYRVSPRSYATREQAHAFAKYYRRYDLAHVGTLTIVDYTDVVKEASEAYISLELMEAKADGMDEEYLGAYEYHLTHGNIEQVPSTCTGCVFCTD
jgi:hypothetical protein